MTVYCFGSLRWAIKAYSQQTHQSHTGVANGLVRKENQEQWDIVAPQESICLNSNIVFHSRQIEQFFLLKCHFPGLGVRTQLFSPEILCLWAAFGQSHGTECMRSAAHVHLHSHLQTPNSWEAPIFIPANEQKLEVRGVSYITWNLKVSCT